VKVPEWLRELVLEETLQFYRQWFALRLDSLYRCRDPSLRWFIINNADVKGIFALPWEAGR